jgi:hypothetical protein
MVTTDEFKDTVLRLLERDDNLSQQIEELEREVDRRAGQLGCVFLLASGAAVLAIGNFLEAILR